MVNRFLDFFGSFREGALILRAGLSEIEVLTSKKPSEIWVHKKDVNGLNVCSAPHDWVDVETTENGFVIYGDISSESVIVEWLVWF